MQSKMWEFETSMQLAKKIIKISIFVISIQKHMLWVLIGSVSMRCFQWEQQPMYSGRNKKSIDIFIWTSKNKY